MTGIRVENLAFRDIRNPSLKLRHSTEPNLTLYPGCDWQFVSNHLIQSIRVTIGWSTARYYLLDLSAFIGGSPALTDECVGNKWKELVKQKKPTAISIFASSPAKVSM